MVSDLTLASCWKVICKLITLANLRYAVPCRLRKLVENGPHPPPGETGAKYIIRSDGKRVDLRFLSKVGKEDAAQCLT